MVKSKTTKQSKKIRIFMIGNDNRPATQEDLENFSNLLQKAIKNNEDVVTHHAVNYFEIEM